jgi:hypothetical protein
MDQESTNSSEGDFKLRIFDVRFMVPILWKLSDIRMFATHLPNGCRAPFLMVVTVTVAVRPEHKPSYLWYTSVKFNSIIKRSKFCCATYYLLRGLLNLSPLFSFNMYSSLYIRHLYVMFSERSLTIDVKNTWVTLQIIERIQDMLQNKYW